MFFPLDDAAYELGCGDASFLEGVDCDRRATSGVAVEDELFIGWWTVDLQLYSVNAVA